MPNPYYIPRHHTTQDLANLGLQLYGLKQRGDIATAQQALTAKELGLRGETVQLERQRQLKEYGTPAFEGDVYSAPTPAIPGLREREMGVHERQVGALEEQNKLAEQKAGGEADLKNFGRVSAKFATNHLIEMGVPKDYPLLQKITAMGPDPKINNAEAFNELKRDYPSYRYDMAEKIADDYTKKVTKDPMYAQSPQGKAQNALIDAIDSDPTGDKVIGSYFPGTIESMKRRELTAKASLPTIQQRIGLAAEEEGMTAEQMGKLIHPPPEAKGTWSEPYDLQGAKVQKNSLTGEVRTAVTRKPGETTAAFKTEKLREMWGRMTDEQRLKALDALPADKELTEKNFLDVFGNIFTDAELKKMMGPGSEDIIKRARERFGGGPGAVAKINVLPEGSINIGTYNGKAVFEAPNGKRYYKE